MQVSKPRAHRAAKAGRSLTFTLAAVLALTCTVGATEQPVQRSVKALVVPYLTKQKVNIDGILDESPWNDALVMGDFAVNEEGNPAASDRTEVRMWYDRHHVYIGVTCFESEMGRANLGLPGPSDADTDLQWQGDVFELMIDPGGEGGRVFHLALDPHAARYDSITIIDSDGTRHTDTTWDRMWNIATSVSKDLWSAELRFPFHQLAVEGEFVGTPRPGSTWGVLFGRAQASSAEFSSYPPVVGRFMQPERFRAVTFPGWDWGNLTVEDVRYISPVGRVGGHEFRAALRSLAPRDAEALCTLRLADFTNELKEIGKVTVNVPAHGTAPLVIPYEIAYGGRWRLNLNVDWIRNSSWIYVGEAAFSVYPVRANLERVVQGLAAIAGGEDLQDEPLAKSLVQAADKLAADAAALLPRSEELPDEAGAWETLVKEIDGLQERYSSLELEYHNKVRAQLWLASRGQSHLPVAVGEVPSSLKVFRDAPYTGRFADTVRITLAQNESESRQIVLFPLIGKGQVSAYVDVSALWGPGGAMFPSEGVEFHRVGYIRVGETPVGSRVGFWPDILYPHPGFSVEKGRLDTTFSLHADKLQPVMVTVRATDRVEPGLYKGNLRINVGAETLKIPFEVEVLPFALPLASTLKMDIWLHDHRFAWMYQTPMTPAMYRKLLEFLGPYRVAGAPFGMWREAFPVLREADGSLTIDFSLADAYLDPFFERYGNVLKLTWTCHGGWWLGHFTSGQWSPRDRQTGRWSHLTEEEKPTFPKRLFREWVEHARQKGWIDRSVVMTVDEPCTKPRQERLRELADIFKEVAPGVKRTAAGACPGMGFEGYVDIWIPLVRQFDDPERFKKGATELWIYQAGLRRRQPDLSIVSPGTAPRALLLGCFKFDIKGFLNWGLNAWTGEKTALRIARGELPIPWASESFPIEAPQLCGDGMYVYPMPDGLVPSTRLVQIRDGVEDYEYLTMLKRLAELSADDAACAGQVAEARKLLRVPLVRNFGDWDKDPDKYEQFREKVARLIVALLEAKS